MNKFLPLYLLLGLAGSTSAQTSAYLDANNIKTPLDTSGQLFRMSSGYYEYEVPAGSGRTMSMLTFPAIVGTHIMSGTLAGALPDRFSPGPLKESTATPSTNPAVWKRVWKVTTDEVNYHLANYTSPGYVPAPAIADWPANGNTLNNEPAQVAPFFDNDGDGIYEPLLGDYPLIRGTQSIFFVFNDNAVPGLPGMGLEIQCMLYAFDCTADSALNNTVFVHYTFINKSTQTYSNAHAGFFSDIDLGYYLDDYIGTDVGRGLVYAYNADAYDEPFAGTYPGPGYGYYLPMQGITLLQGPYDDADGLDNGIHSDYVAALNDNGIMSPALGVGYGDGTTDNERLGMAYSMAYTGVGAPNANMADPTTMSEWNNYLSGLWRDGSQPVFGGAGYPGLTGSTSTPTDFMFFGNTSPGSLATRGVTVPDTWREDLAGNLPSDRRLLYSTGDFTLAPGEYNDLDLAFITAIHYTGAGTPLDADSLLKARTDQVRSAFLAGSTACGDFIFNGIRENKNNQASFSIYPNPVGHTLTFTLAGTNDKNRYMIYNAAGQLVMQGDVPGTQTTIDVSGLGEGFYFLSINGSGAEKFVVQR